MVGGQQIPLSKMKGFLQPAEEGRDVDGCYAAKVGDVLCLTVMKRNSCSEVTC